MKRATAIRRTKEEATPSAADSIEARLKSALPDLTRSERQVASHLLGHYPVAALGSLSALAREVGVSGPTVARLVHKLGFKGYPHFQALLREEVGEKLASPLAKRDKWSESELGAHMLSRFADTAVANLEATLAQIDPADFDDAADLLADPSRRVYMLGGRITHALADYFCSLLKMMRADVTLLSDMSNTWPPALIDMAAGDVLVVFDIRRYETSVAQMAELARERGAEVVLITDRWISPAAAHARQIMPCHVEAPSAWDSNASLLVLVEALLAAVQARDWEGTRNRLTSMEALYARTQFFRRGR